ncbi:MAG: hypothetical protein ABSE69_02240 [Roseiarcus sp.]|jgi:hypothetical protein
MQQSRKQVKALRIAVRSGDAEAARLLPAHSVALGHEQLSVRRYFIVLGFGALDFDCFKSFSQAAQYMPRDVVLTMGHDTNR